MKTQKLCHQEVNTLSPNTGVQELHFLILNRQSDFSNLVHNFVILEK